jgi:hypothetical protein
LGNAWNNITSLRIELLKPSSLGIKFLIEVSPYLKEKKKQRTCNIIDQENNLIDQKISLASETIYSILFH